MQRIQKPVSRMHIQVHGKWTILQIPKCIRRMSHNAPFCSRNMHIWLVWIYFVNSILKGYYIYLCCLICYICYDNLRYNGTQLNLNYYMRY